MASEDRKYLTDSLGLDLLAYSWEEHIACPYKNRVTIQ